MRILILVVLISVVSAQTFFNNGRRSFRPSRGLRRALGNGGSADAAYTQIKEPNGSAAPAAGGAYPPQEQTKLPDGASAGGAIGSPDESDGISADEGSPDAPIDGGDGDVGSDGGVADGNGDELAAGSLDSDLPDDGSAAGGVVGNGIDDEPERDPNDLTGLRNAIRGEPDVDYPILSQIPKTAFKCSEQADAGYYGDPEARCQVFHICQKPDDRMDSFLCPNGTIFSQKNFVCVWWWQYDCSQTEKDYGLNANLYSGGENGDGQSYGIDASAGGASDSDSDAGGADGDAGYGTNGNGASDGSADTADDASVDAAAGGADDTDVAPMEPSYDGAAGGDAGSDGSPADGPADDGAAAGLAPTAGGSVTPAGKTNVAVRRRVRGRARRRFNVRSGRRSARRRPARRGLRSRSTLRRGRGRSGLRSFGRSTRRRSSGRRAARRSSPSRRRRRNRI